MSYFYLSMIKSLFLSGLHIVFDIIIIWYFEFIRTLQDLIYHYMYVMIIDIYGYLYINILNLTKKVSKV